MPFAIDQDVI
jgi:hypothetical protein